MVWPMRFFSVHSTRTAWVESLTIGRRISLTLGFPWSLRSRSRDRKGKHHTPNDWLGPITSSPTFTAIPNLPRQDNCACVISISTKLLERTILDNKFTFQTAASALAGRPACAPFYSSLSTFLVLLVACSCEDSP